MSIRSRRAANKVLKIVLLGDGEVGKSSLMNMFVHERFDSRTYQTIGVEFLTKNMTSTNMKGISSQTFTIQIWDTAGQERFKSLRTPFFRGADACLLTFSVDNLNSFVALDKWRDEFLKYSDVTDSSIFPFIVLGNKIDLPTNQHKVSREMALDWCKKQRLKHYPSKISPPIGGLDWWPYFETSAKTSTNVATAFQASVDLCAWQYATCAYSMDYKNSAVNLTSLPHAEGEESKCC